MPQCMYGKGSATPCIANALPRSAFCPAHKSQEQAEPPKTGADPQMVAAQMATAMMAQEQIARQRLQEKTKVRRYQDGTREDEAPRAPFKVFTRRSRPDRSVPVDPVTGKYPESIPEGWVVRHVRTRDHENRPSLARVADREAYGFMPVPDKNGDTIEGPLGLLMMGPPEAQAEMTRDNTPPKAMLRDDALDAALDIESQITQIAGTGAAAVVTEADHGRRRTMEGPGTTVLDE